MFTVYNYISSIKINLEKHSDLLIGNLQNIFAYNFYSDIDILDFTAFIDPTRFELSIRMFSMDKGANEVFYEGMDKTVFAGSGDVLLEIKYHELNDSQFDDFFDFYEQNEDMLFSQEQKLFTDWFSQCWQKAGGNQLDLPSYFAYHNDYKSYDLKKNQWVYDEEKWS